MAIETLQRTRLATLAILVMVFGTGVLMGLVLDRSLTAAPADGSVAVDTVAAEEERPRRYMFEEVDLSPEQRAVVDSLAVRHRAAMSALRQQFSEEYDPQYRAIVVATREAIKDVMTPEQAAKYDSLTTARDRQNAAEDSASGEGKD